MEYIKAKTENAREIYNLVQNTITTIYPKYYPQEVVDFFCQLHNEKNIITDIIEGTVGILINNTQLIGTGSHKDNHITRVYIDPAFQGQGYGSYMMQILENEIALQYDTVYLDASLPASHMYENRGYITTKHEKWKVENGVFLVYEVMQKRLSTISSSI